MARQGLAYLDEKKIVAALNQFDKALEIDENNSFALFGKGKIFVQKTLTLNIGRKMLLRSLPGLEDIALKKEAYLLLSKTSPAQESIKILQRAILDQSIVGPEFFHALADSQLKDNRVKEAASTYHWGIKRYPDDITLQKKLGILSASRLRNYQEAYSIFKSVIEKAPKDIEALYSLSKISYIFRKREEALEYLDQILEQRIKFSLINIVHNAKEEIRSYSWRPSFKDSEINL